jgi:heat shock protein HtpX
MRNVLHMTLLVAGLALLTGLLGWIIAGTEGVVWTIFLSMVLFWFSPRLSPRMVLKLYSARLVYPGEAPRLEAIIRELARRAGLPRTPDLYYIPSRIMNAFTLGTGKETALVLTDGIIRQLSPRELTGVLAHEISHAAHKDIAIMGFADLLNRITAGFSLFGQLLVLINLPLVLFGDYSFNWLPILLLVASPTLATLLQLALSRTREFEADLGAARLTGDPMGLASALTRLEYSSGSWLTRVLFPGRKETQPSLIRTHPHTEERVARLRELAASKEFHPREMHPVFQQPQEPPFPHAARVSRPRWRPGGFWF